MHAQDYLRQWSQSRMGRGVSRWAPLALLMVLVWGGRRLAPVVRPYAAGIGRTAAAWPSRVWRGANERVIALAGKRRAGGHKDV